MALPHTYSSSGGPGPAIGDPWRGIEKACWWKHGRATKAVLTFLRDTVVGQEEEEEEREAEGMSGRVERGEQSSA